MGTLEKRCLLLRVQFRRTLHARGDAAHCPPDVLAVAVAWAWVDVGREQVQVVGAVGQVRRRRPVEASRATIVHRTTVDVAGIDEIDWVFAPTERIGCSGLSLASTTYFSV